ncbi:Glyoxylase, beta-lactamase superfamily II [Sphingomonas gellani]|uniref:Glyoxylase, beta-lactamase superfamily II n=1 Tax=Sphingomonas gellani TaxID=1166340 RepID=A0A1H7YJZ4_9SPHN|nr:MBL fold metallo-hydrolase [Sphingomonas gellani]SEM46261.1 Glyoxylase, beta-lactamase superfamily II [Sphingomonas gellani]
MAEPPYGIPIGLEPLVARVLAPNPSPFTFTGTQSYLVGTDTLAVIDPGPDDAAHHGALLQAIGARQVTAILITHHHRDHSPGARALAAATGAPIIGAAPFVGEDAATRSDASFDADYRPDRVLADGEAIEGEGWTLEAVATPGHTSNHLAFALRESGALFSGDHVMGWSTSVVSPPDGNMGQYIASLEKLLGRSDRIYYPGHGDIVEAPQRMVRGMLGHRKQREGQILRRLAAGPERIEPLVAGMYAGLDERLLPAARQSVLAHLIDLDARGLVRQEDGVWSSRP